MNFLAHAYLSFNNDGLLIGNMISDFVKGRKQYDYSPEIQQGIRLHRAIDMFTDDHPIVKEAKQYFRPSVGLYAGAFIDVAFDHFLANDQLIFTEDSLAQFSQTTYKTLMAHNEKLPLRFQQVLPYMVQHDWLFNYKSLYGMQQSFDGLVRRAKYLESSKEAFAAFQQHYVALQKCYSEFFPQLQAFAAQHLLTLHHS